MKKRGADIVIETLIENGIKNAFSVVGGGAMHLNNAFALKRDLLQTTYNHHEQASAMAAEAYARLTGNLAAVCVTSGPGGLNTLNGVQGAWVDSLPMIVIAGHPRYNTTVEASGLDVRCIGVQENDIIPQVRNITKYAKLVTDPKALKREVKYAIDIAMDGRRGPVWISVPLDVQGELIDECDLFPCVEFIPNRPQLSMEDVEDVYRTLKAAKRPVILSGSGIRSSNAINEYRKFLELFDVPIVGGYGAPDANFNGQKNYYGMSGVLGPRCGNFILQNADCILILGNSMSSSQTGFNVDAFAPSAIKIMIDVQPDESKKQGLEIRKCVWADLKEFFILYTAHGYRTKAPNDWIEFCDVLKSSLPNYEVLDILPKDNQGQPIHPMQFWKIFLEKAEADSIIALGNSSCVQGVLQEGVSSELQRVLVNYHSGSMGTDLPFAEGSSEGAKESPVYCVTGDGCFMMNLQELETIKYNKYRIKIVLFCNNGYDNIRLTCRNYFHNLCNGCDPDSGISIPDFEKIASAFGYKYRKVNSVAELESGIDWIISNEKQCILEINEKKDKERAPLIRSVMDESGQFTTPPLHVMSPLLKNDKIEAYSQYYNRQVKK